MITNSSGRSESSFSAQSLQDDQIFSGEAENLIKAIKSRYKQRKLKLLVANDSIFQLLLIKTALQKLSYVGQIVEASNGQEALDLVKVSKNPGNKPFDVILLDLDMPIVDGFEACQKMIQFFGLFIDNQNLSKHAIVKAEAEEKRSKSCQWVQDLDACYRAMYPDNDRSENDDSPEFEKFQTQLEIRKVKFQAVFNQLKFKAMDF